MTDYRITSIVAEGFNVYVVVQDKSTQQDKSFLFNMNEIKDEKSLKEKIKYSLEAEIKLKNEVEAKITQLKIIEGSDITIN